MLHELPILSLLGRWSAIEFGLGTHEHGGWSVLDVKGEVDIYTAPKVRERLVELIDGGARSVIVNLEGVSFMDSTGLGSLVAGLKRMREQDGRLELVCSRETVLKILQITGLDRVFAVHGSLEAATG